MRKKILTKAAAVLAVGAIATGLSSALAVPASAVNVSSSIGTGFQYTLTTKRISSTKFDVIFQSTNNPGVTNFHFAISGDSGVKCVDVKKMESEDNAACMKAVENGVGQVFFISNSSDLSGKTDVYGKMSFTFEFEVVSGTYSDHKLQAGMLSYFSKTDNVKYSSPSSSVPSNDATVVVTPSQSVRLGDVDCNGKIDSTDIFYMRQMILEAPNNKLSTTYLDLQLKNTSSSWYKSYSFMKCAAVADINHDEWIQNDDADALMLYVAQKGAGATVSNKEINTLFPVTVVYDNK